MADKTLRPKPTLIFYATPILWFSDFFVSLENMLIVRWKFWEIGYFDFCISFLRCKTTLEAHSSSQNQWRTRLRKMLELCFVFSRRISKICFGSDCDHNFYAKKKHETICVGQFGLVSRVLSWWEWITTCRFFPRGAVVLSSCREQWSKSFYLQFSVIFFPTCFFLESVIHRWHTCLQFIQC